MVKPRRGGRGPAVLKPITIETERENLIAGDDNDDTLKGLSQASNETQDQFELVLLHQTRALLCYGCSKRFIKETEKNI